MAAAPGAGCRDARGAVLISAPLVSIALATYNGERYLAEQLDSLLAQDYPHFEIVASDDNSTDGTVALLHRYAAQDARLRVLSVAGDSRVNKGFNGNFARCFAACKGELISPCDQDDVWHLDKTRRLVDDLGDAIAIYANSCFIDGDGQPLHRKLSDDVRMVAGSDPRPFLFGNSVSGHAMLFRKDLLMAAGNFPQAIYYDWWLAFVATSTGRLAYLDAVLVDYRRHAAAVTCSPKQKNSAQRRLNSLRHHAQRFAAMAAYPGPQQAFIQDLQARWWSWYRSFFGWQMCVFLLSHSELLFGRRSEAWQRAMKYLLGHRLKRVLMPRRFLLIDDAVAATQSCR